MTLGAARPNGLRSKGREKPCPRCGAKPGDMCSLADGTPRVSNHRERHTGKIMKKEGEAYMARKKKPTLYAVGSDGGEAKIMGYLETASQTEASRFIDMGFHVGQDCESPIERLLMAALYAYSRNCPEVLNFRTRIACQRDPLPYREPEARIYVQEEIGPYRVDILIHDATLGIADTRYMIIECDGHDFHEKTKEQARRDKQRDRFFVSTGFKVLHFTGSEIWADPDACADEIVNELACNDAWRNRKK